ncbi:MAG: hypothetical protein EOO19_00560 [Chryseobacterium sp.]|nr:MAG: hypothetical protein EOO19_00560 [Chryseobacterium sp.]
MKDKTRLLVPLFEQFIRDSFKGRRLKADGSRIKPQTVNNYVYVLRYLREYENLQGEPLRIKVLKTGNQRLFDAEKKYWRKFYERFTQFLYHKKKCFDNYVGNVIKNIRIFFNWMKLEKGIQTGDFYKGFYVCREDVPIVTLQPMQLQFLLNDVAFHERLPKPLQKTKSIFVFGCTVALRASDLFAIRFTDIETVGIAHYLAVKTIKTGTIVRVKLPAYAMRIVEHFRLTAKRRKQVFPPIPRNRFNHQLKEICEAAGWVQALGKSRARNGVAIEMKKCIDDGWAVDESAGCRNSSGSERYRFCDLVSSHTMRRTAITTMLMMGMKEHVVKQISGHANDSKSFYRYVNLVQSYLDNEMDEVFGRLVEG